MKYLIQLSFLTALFFPVGCTQNNVEPLADYKDLLTNVANDVIVATYKDLYDKTEILVNTVATLETNPTPTNLAASRQAWRDARVPWEQAEGFLFGPVDQKGIDPSIDSWPVNQPDLDAVLNSTDALTKAYIDGLDGTLKGFHTIEYLLFGADANKPLSAFTPRQFEYLKACTQSLNGATQTLYYSWKADQQNFVANIITAGQPGNSVYPSQKSALEEIITGMVTIADEVANGKINDPLIQQNVNLEESRFSLNSKQDFADNIRSIKNIYWGIYKNTSGLGLSALVLPKNSALDSKVKVQIEEAIAAIEAIEGVFTTAIFDAKPSVENAQQKVRTLQQTLESEVLPIISNL